MILEELEQKGEGIPPSLRPLIIIEEVARMGFPVTPTEINTNIGLPKPTIHRLFATLEEQGFLQRDIDGRSYTVGPRLRSLSTNTLSSLRIRTARLAILTTLSNEIGETCNIAIPDRDAMLYFDRVETKWPLRIQLPIGSHVPFYCTASGKMYLSTLKDTHLKRYIENTTLLPSTKKTITESNKLMRELNMISANEYSTDNEEFIDGMVAIAVPIFDDQKRLVSTLSFHAPKQRISLAKAKSYIPKLRKAATELSSLLFEDS